MEHLISVGTDKAREAVEARKTRKKAAGAAGLENVGASPETFSVSSLDVASKINRQTTNLVQVITAKGVEFSEDRVVRVYFSPPIDLMFHTTIFSYLS